MVTIKDVAKLANVSVGTTSRALQGVGYVSKESKEKVYNAAKELGYIVNLGAKKLKSNSSKKTIGIIISDFGNDYFYKVMSVLHEQLQALNIDFIITFSARHPEDEIKQFKYLISNRVSTILFIPSTDTNKDILDLADKNKINVIQLFVRVYKDYTAIVNDDEQGCFLATERLIKLKCKRIILIDVDYSNYNTIIEPSRSEGFIKCLNNHPNVKHLILSHDPLSPFNNEIINQIEKFNPDGIITGTGLTGLKVLKYLKNSSKKIKFVSFDDNEWFDYHGVTTIKQNTKELAKMICDSIINNNANLPNDIYQIVGESIIIREE